MNSRHLHNVTLSSLLATLIIFAPMTWAGFGESFGIYTGIYSPSEESTDSIYGSGLMLGVRYEIPIHPDIGIALVTSIGVLKTTGNPYTDTTFIATHAPSRMTFVPAEISYIINLISNQPGIGRRIRRVYVGLGVNHIWARERAPGSSLAKGNEFGGQVLAGADLFLSKHLGFGLEIKYLRNRPLMKLDAGADYRVELDGTRVQATAVWNFGVAR